MKLRKNQIIKLERKGSEDNHQITGEIEWVSENNLKLVERKGYQRIQDWEAWEIEVIEEYPARSKLPFCFVVFSLGKDNTKRCIMVSSSMETKKCCDLFVSEWDGTSFNIIISDNLGFDGDKWTLFQEKLPRGFYICSGYIEHQRNDCDGEAKAYGEWIPIKGNLVETYDCDERVKEIEKTIDERSIQRAGQHHCRFLE